MYRIDGYTQTAINKVKSVRIVPIDPNCYSKHSLYFLSLLQHKTKVPNRIEILSNANLTVCNLSVNASKWSKWKQVVQELYRLEPCVISCDEVPDQNSILQRLVCLD